MTASAGSVCTADCDLDEAGQYGWPAVMFVAPGRAHRDERSWGVLWRRGHSCKQRAMGVAWIAPGVLGEVAAFARVVKALLIVSMTWPGRGEGSGHVKRWNWRYCQGYVPE